MRKQLIEAITRYADDKTIFLTGDLGFDFQDQLKQLLHKQFINCGVAEQNMVSVAAGLARNGMKPFVYSISPFLYKRALEQIANDVCMHNLPVTFIGSGGGFSYGVMGPSHHALEDYGILSTLPNLQIFIPSFNEDIDTIVHDCMNIEGPTWIRVGLDERPADVKIQKFAEWRNLICGEGWTVITVGPLAGGIWDRLRHMQGAVPPSLWVISTIPTHLPIELIKDIRTSGKLLVVEEHVMRGGIGEKIACMLFVRNVNVEKFVIRATISCGGSVRSGSQKWYREMCAIDPNSIEELVMNP